MSRPERKFSLCKRLIGLLGAASIASSVLVAGGGAANAEPKRSSDVAKKLQAELNELKLGEIMDSAPPGSSQARRAQAVSPDPEPGSPERARPRSAAEAKPVHQQPQFDATVIELNEKGKPVSSGTVLTSPKYAKGVIVPVDKNFHTKDVRYREWDTAKWDSNKGQGDIDIVPGREDASIDYMSPYPASILKLMVGFGVLRLADKGEIKLDDNYAYQPVDPPEACGKAVTRTIRDYFDRMITVSENEATCSLIKLLHDRKAIDGLNQTFQDWGLETLQLKGTNPATGAKWFPNVTMSSLDTAKLLALINGVDGTAWTSPDGKPVSGKVLSGPSRQFFKKTLGEQAWNNVLSTTNYCGYDYPAKGLPQVTPKRWIGPDGKVTIGTDPDGKYANPVEPCQKAAQVNFAHKTGLIENGAGDAGIVKSLPGKAKRNYIIVSFSNLGYRYFDQNRPADVKPGVNRTERFAKLGSAMDAYEARR